MDPWIQIFGVVGQLLFYGGLLMLLCGLPLFVWLAVRACRDLHRIAHSLERLASSPADPLAGKVDRIAREISRSPGVANSAFGR